VHLSGTGADGLGAAYIRDGRPVDGLLLLRTAAQDWLLRGDSRVWDVLHTVATGLAVAGEVTIAARIRAAIGERHLSFVARPEQQRLRSLVETGLGEDDRARQERAGRGLDAGAAVTEALSAIAAMAPSDGI
jgi:hypothetical protein